MRVKEITWFWVENINALFEAASLANSCLCTRLSLWCKKRRWQDTTLKRRDQVGFACVTKAMPRHSWKRCQKEHFTESHCANNVERKYYLKDCGQFSFHPVPDTNFNPCLLQFQCVFVIPLGDFSTRVCAILWWFPSNYSRKNWEQAHHVA